MISESRKITQASKAGTMFGLAFATVCGTRGIQENFGRFSSGKRIRRAIFSVHASMWLLQCGTAAQQRLRGAMAGGRLARPDGDDPGRTGTVSPPTAAVLNVMMRVVMMMMRMLSRASSIHLFGIPSVFMARGPGD